MSPEHKRKWEEAMALHRSDPAYKKKLSEGHKKSWAEKTPEEMAAFRAKVSASKKGKGNGRDGLKWSDQSRRKLSESAKARGAKHNFFKDGMGHERDTERRVAMKGVEYRLWREKVFERDDYMCQQCGERGGELHADHIKRWKEFPELRYDVSNGRTLCVDCHINSETYGNRKASA